MKCKTLFICLSGSSLLLAATAINAQETLIKKRNVPKAIQTYIQTNYPNATKEKYYHELDNDTLFIECDFRSDSVTYSLKFLESAELYEIETNIKFNDITDSVRQKIDIEIQKKHPSYRIIKCQRKCLKTNILYEITFKHKGRLYEYHFTIGGLLISAEEKKSYPITNYF